MPLTPTSIATQKTRRFLSASVISISLLLTACDFSNNETPNQAAIASAHPLATEAGMLILEQGGNAFDAAVAVAATLSVVEPYSAGLGGGGFWLLHDAKNNKNIFVDAREKAPSSSHRDMYLDDEGNTTDLSVDGPLAAGIPGQAAAFAHLAKHYGMLPLSMSLAPAIKHAQQGFAVDEHYQSYVEWRLETLQNYPSSHVFLQNGELPEPGYLIKQLDLANTLQALVDNGHDGFYSGPVAQTMVNSVQNSGGIWTLADLANYNIVERDPIQFSYRGKMITSAPPPSSGGIALASMLNMLENYDLDQLSKVERTHIMVEAMRRAYRDRAEFLGDSDFVDVPVAHLISKDYAKTLINNISLNSATPSSALKPIAPPNQGNHTTHFSVLDTEGNRVSATLSINLPFGSAFVAEGTGVILNNEMDDFSAKPGTPNAYGLVGAEANAIEPNKRPLSSMSPSFVEDESDIALLGTPGGSRIITMVMLGMLDHVDGNPVEHWVELPRFHHQYLPDAIQIEDNTFTDDEKHALMQLGHSLKLVSYRYGNMQAIHWDKANNKVTAASDPRGVGLSLVK